LLPVLSCREYQIDKAQDRSAWCNTLREHWRGRPENRVRSYLSLATADRTQIQSEDSFGVLAAPICPAARAPQSGLNLKMKKSPCIPRQPELAKFGVRATSTNRVECLDCQRRWGVKPGRCGALSIDFWRCPKGCNSSLANPTRHQRDKIELEVYFADAGYNPGQSQLRSMRGFKRTIRKLETLRHLYSRMRGENSPSWAQVRRACNLPAYSGPSVAGRVRQPSTS